MVRQAIPITFYLGNAFLHQDINT